MYIIYRKLLSKNKNYVLKVLHGHTYTELLNGDSGKGLA